MVDLVHNEEYKENALKEFAEMLRDLCHDNNSDKEELDTMNKQQFLSIFKKISTLTAQVKD